MRAHTLVGSNYSGLLAVCRREGKPPFFLRPLGRVVGIRRLPTPHLVAEMGRTINALPHTFGLSDKLLAIMEEKQIAPMGSFCLNEAWEEDQKVNHGNMMKYRQTEKGVQRYRCKTCKKTFTETKGTMFYRCRHAEEEIGECRQMLGDRNSLAAIHRIKGVKEETVCNWLER